VGQPTISTPHVLQLRQSSAMSHLSREVNLKGVLCHVPSSRIPTFPTLKQARRSMRSCGGLSLVPRSSRKQAVVHRPGGERPQDRKSSDGADTGGSLVLDVAARMGLRTTAEFRFARRTTRTSPWCAVNHRRNDCVSCSSPRKGKEFELGIMIARATEEMDGSD
jgi:hypothetical protein